MRAVCLSLYVNLRTSFLMAAVLGAGTMGCTDAPVAPKPQIQSGPVTDRGVNDANAIVVTNAAELVAALTPANADRKILVRSGSYAITQRLVVPDGATVAGEGEMLFDDSGLPTGFAAGTRTTIRMTANVTGDVLTLGNGSSIRDIAVEDLTGRVGSVVAIDSRSAGDTLSAAIAEVEIVNPNVHAVLPAGPSGCGVTMVTQNPHAGAAVSARVTRSLIHSPATGAGCGIFAFNFASLANVSVDLTDNVIGGGMIANGGVSRPAAVHDSRTIVQSRRNLYIDDSPNPCVSRRSGWNLAGGSGVPAPIVIGTTSGNALDVHSQSDRLERFTLGILAAGGRRFFGLPISGPVNDNRIDLNLIGTTLSTSSCGTATVTDFRLVGALVSSATLTPGDGNVVQVVMRNVTGSGARTNFYADALGSAGPLPAEIQGTGNRLEFEGSLPAFEHTNQNITPLPGAEFFTGGT